MKSQTFTVPPLLGCLVAAEKYLRDNALLNRVSWTGVSDDQREFVERFVSKIGDVEKIRDVLRMIAHKEARVINKWLADNGYEIRLSSQEGANTFCVASILDVLVEWLAKGSVTAVKGNYPAVRIKEDDGAYVVSGSGQPVACVRTKGDEVVFMRMIDREPEGPMGIADMLRDLPEEMSRDGSYGSVVFPMLDCDQVVDVSWLVGLCTGHAPTDWYVKEAVQQTRFRMNEVGARAQSAAAMMMKCRSIERPKQELVIDRPFLLWIERKGVGIPLFAGVFAEDSWRRPESIGEAEREPTRQMSIQGHLAEAQRLGLIE